MFDFCVIPGTAIKSLLEENPAQSMNAVENAYLAHHDGNTVNPDSYFLRFPERPGDRIIALPAALGSEPPVCGIKWIASFPDNIRKGFPRASAVLLLNDPATGYPYACLEGSLISAARTAASAVLGAYWMNNRVRQANTMAFIGAGIIARNILDTFIAADWHIGQVLVHDMDAPSAHALAAHAAGRISGHASVSDGLEEALRADVVVFATNAGVPYVAPPLAFRPGQIVLNVSLRDIAPELILDAENIFDDVDHCMKANTSPHLAEQKVGNRDFVTGTLASLMRGEIRLDRTRPLIFSPFGMGILDLALGMSLFEQARARGWAVPIPGFFGETTRW